MIHYSTALYQDSHYTRKLGQMTFFCVCVCFIYHICVKELFSNTIVLLNKMLSDAKIIFILLPRN